MIDYYELRGVEWPHKFPSGMFRVVTTDEGMSFERVDLHGKWVWDPDLARHLGGYDDTAEPITEKEAKAFLDYLRSGQALRDKKKGSWT
jgi:hypothetical protein